MNANMLSIIAIIISVLSSLFEYLYNRKLNNVNCDARYYDEVYEEFLLTKIPNARLFIWRDENGEVTGIDEFLLLLREMRKKSLYFKFSNEDFYKRLYSLLQNLEDEAVLLNNMVDEKEFNDFQLILDNKIYEIYSCINDARHGE